jgi:hypothetical protein
MPTMKDLKDLWVPRKYQKTGIHRYCSPGCGGDCTDAAHRLARRNANRLCDDLGQGWEPRVWENLGWHYSALKGQCQVYEYYSVTGKRAGHADLSVEGVRQFIAEWSGDPKKGVRKVGEFALTAARVLNTAIAEVLWS